MKNIEFRTIKNTEPEFFEDWPKEQLIKECVRLNLVLVESRKSLDEAIDTLTILVTKEH